MSKIIAIANEKGGVGKTTTTFNLGHALALQQENVLLVDLDSQGNLTSLSGLSAGEQSVTVSDLLAASANGNAAEIHPEQYSIERGVVDIIPANDTLAIAATQLTTAMGREYILADALAPFKPLYDYILIDCKPSLDVITINALTAADSIIVVTNAAQDSIHGVGMLIEHVRQLRQRINPSLVIEGILITMVDQRTKITRHHITTLHQNAGMSKSQYIFKAHIPKSIKVEEAATKSLSLFDYAYQSAPAQAYAALALELFEREGRTKSNP